MADALRAYENADASEILPPSVRPFKLRDFAARAGSRLVVGPRSVLGVGAFGAVFEAVYTPEHGSPLIVAVKYQALPEEVRL